MIVRHSYISIRLRKTRGGNWKAAKKGAIRVAVAHANYISNRPGEDREKGGRCFFDQTRENIQPSDIRSWLRKQEPGRDVVIHKLVLSPEVNVSDPVVFTKEVMGQIAREKGLELDWKAVVHRNTDNHHVHVIVGGKDKYGREVRFNRRDYDLIRQTGDRYVDRHHSVERDLRREQRQHQYKRGIFSSRVARDAYRSRHYLEPGKSLALANAYPESSRYRGKNTTPLREDYQFSINGKTYSRENSLKELKSLDNHLWDSRLSAVTEEQYKYLAHWIKDKTKEERINKRQDKDRLTARQQVDLQSNKAPSSSVLNLNPSTVRFVSPIESEVTGHPVFGILMQANAIVRVIISPYIPTAGGDLNKQQQDIAAQLANGVKKSRDEVVNSSQLSDGNTEKSDAASNAVETYKEILVEIKNDFEHIIDEVNNHYQELRGQQFRDDQLRSRPLGRAIWD